MRALLQDGLVCLEIMICNKDVNYRNERLYVVHGCDSSCEGR